MGSVTLAVQDVSTTELNEGEVVYNEGMVIRLGERKEGSRDGQRVVWFIGSVLNRQELTDPVSGRAVWPLTGLLTTSGEHAWEWTVQGNGLATWHRVMCSWYAMCVWPAAGVLAHPVLGMVPTCDRCKGRAVALGAGA